MGNAAAAATLGDLKEDCEKLERYWRNNPPTQQRVAVPNNADPKPGTRDDFYCSIAGYQTPLAADQLHALYKDSGAYRSKVKQRLDELTKAGWFLPEYAGQVTGDAEKVHLQ